MRIGILGAARIAPMALIRPARFVPAATVAAVAARDPQRARQFAARHGIPRPCDTYEALLADPEIEAIYNPLPNSLHCSWSIKALEAGKHVLCEKPFASNAAEAETMAEAAQRNGRVLMEAFHWRYHPLAARLRAVIDSGELGTVEHVEAHLCIPLPFRNDIRFQHNLGGGATMDTGCYAISVLRFLAGAEPEVVAAGARLMSPQVDRHMEATFRFPGGASGRITCALLSAVLLRASASVRGTKGVLRVLNPIAPQFFHYLHVRTDRGSRFERVTGEASYTCQLRAFTEAVRKGTVPPTNPQDAIANMRVIDEVYRAAGLSPRGT